MISAVDQSTAVPGFSQNFRVRTMWQHLQTIETPTLLPISSCSMTGRRWTRKQSLDGPHLFPLWRDQLHANGGSALPLHIAVKIVSLVSEKGHSGEQLENVV